MIPLKNLIALEDRIDQALNPLSEANEAAPDILEMSRDMEDLNVEEYPSKKF